MKELTFGTLIAVFEEIFGRGLFWIMVALAALVTLAYLYVLIRDRAVSMRKFLWAQLSMPFGAILAVIFVQRMTHSGLRDIGGPIDVIVLLAWPCWAPWAEPSWSIRFNRCCGRRDPGRIPDPGQGACAGPGGRWAFFLADHFYLRV